MTAKKLTGEVGLGISQAPIAVYIANRPVNDHYPTLNTLQPLAAGELNHIVANNTNHWRKVFNVYAKLIWQLGLPFNEPQAGQHLASSWQQYRDLHLLQAHSREALLFSKPQFYTSTCEHKNTAQISIIAGKTYATTLNLPPLTWLDAHFAINAQTKVVVCPYLDYRQLSNARIEKLADIIHALKMA